MQQPVWKRLLWLAIIWGGSVLALAAVSMLFRMLMTTQDLNRINVIPGNRCVARYFSPHFQINPINAWQSIVTLEKDSRYL